MVQAVSASHFISLPHLLVVDQSQVGEYLEAAKRELHHFLDQAQGSLSQHDDDSWDEEDEMKAKLNAYLQQVADSNQSSHE